MPGVVVYRAAERPFRPRAAPLLTGPPDTLAALGARRFCPTVYFMCRLEYYWARPGGGRADMAQPKYCRRRGSGLYLQVRLRDHWRRGLERQTGSELGADQCMP